VEPQVLEVALSALRVELESLWSKRHSFVGDLVDQCRQQHERHVQALKAEVQGLKRSVDVEERKAEGLRREVQELANSVVALRGTYSDQLQLMGTKVAHLEWQQQDVLQRQDQTNARLLSPDRGKLDTGAQVRTCEDTEFRKLVADVGSVIQFKQNMLEKLASEQKERAAELSDLVQQVQAEREDRCASVVNLHSSLLREAADIRLVVETAVEAEKTARSFEAKELRATLDAVWKRVEGASLPTEDCAKYYFKYTGADGPTYKECTGDPGDINTLYEMVREAVGDSFRISQDLAEEKASRCEDVEDVRGVSEQLKSALASLEGKLKTAPGRHEFGELQAKSQRMQQQLAALQQKVQSTSTEDGLC